MLSVAAFSASGAIAGRPPPAQLRYGVEPVTIRGRLIESCETDAKLRPASPTFFTVRPPHRSMNSVCCIPRWLLVLLVGLLVQNASAQSNEYILVSGGPALRQWEDLRRAGEQHDRWWGNFVVTAMVRVKELRKTQPNLPITWLVYRDAYLRRASVDRQPYTTWIQEKQAKYNINVVWFRSGADVINYINAGQNRSRVKISGFEYYGHSNKYCFMFDYSSDIYGVSSSWLHQNDLKKIRSSAFASNAYCHSWGCHTGEAMSEYWKKATGVWMVGAVGKSDFSNLHLRDNRVGLSAGGYWKSKK